MAKSMAWSDPDTGGVAAPRPRCAGVTAGGELVFVLFGLAATLGIMESEDAELLVLVVTASMILSPVLLALYDVTFKGTQSKLAPNLIRLKKATDRVALAAPVTPTLIRNTAKRWAPPLIQRPSISVFEAQESKRQPGPKHPDCRCV